MLTFRQVANWIAGLEFAIWSGRLWGEAPSTEAGLRPSDTRTKPQRPSRSQCYFLRVSVWLKMSISSLVLAEFLIPVSTSCKTWAFILHLPALLGDAGFNDKEDTSF